MCLIEWDKLLTIWATNSSQAWRRITLLNSFICSLASSEAAAREAREKANLRFTPHEAMADWPASRWSPLRASWMPCLPPCPWRRSSALP
jgi:hypothetical protein